MENALPNYTIRLLTREDGPIYQQLRLQSLQNDPEAFLSTFENEKKFHENVFSDHLDWAYHPPLYGYFGIFVKNNSGESDVLAGYVQVSKTYLDKQEHVAVLNNLYIAPQFRKKGFASILFRYVFDELKKSDKIERLFLTCSAKNDTALHFYDKMGFVRYGLKEKSIKWANQYDDEVEMVKVL